MVALLKCRIVVLLFLKMTNDNQYLKLQKNIHP